MKKYNLSIKNIVDIEKDTKTFYFEKPDGLIWDEGAHIHLAYVGFDLGDVPDKTLVRHMSIMTLPEENIIGITTRCPGSESIFKKRLSQLEVRDNMVLFKVGSRLKLIRKNRPLILLSMGVGISSMRPVINKYLADRSGISKLVSINIDQEYMHLFRGELATVEEKNYESYWVSTRAEFYEKLVNLTSIKEAIYYVVGSDQFLKDVIVKLKNHSVKSEDIILDKKEEKRLMFL